MSIILRRSWLLIVFILAGCGTFAPSVWEASTATAVAEAQQSDNQTIQEPTVIPPTPTQEPTLPPTEEPTSTQEPTLSPTDEPTPTQEPIEESASLQNIIEAHNPENGAELFKTFQVDAGFACSTCHNSDSENRLIGPGLLNVSSRAETRVEGQSALEYMYTSIINPSEYVVADYPDELMPANWKEIYNDDEIYDIMAYLMTLGDDDTSSADTTDSSSSNISSTITLPDTVDAENGAELFKTFQVDAGFACSTCHNADSENRLIGPGLLNVGSRAETRVEGQSALEYMYTSITNPSEYVVADYPDELMPANWKEIYNDDEIYDIMAYLLTLKS